MALKTGRIIGRVRERKAKAGEAARKAGRLEANAEWIASQERLADENARAYARDAIVAEALAQRPRNPLAEAWRRLGIGGRPRFHDTESLPRSE